MENLEKYLKYYWLENYLFDNVNKSFHNRGHLNPEEFFAIVIWKSNRAKTNVRRGIIKSARTICAITSEIFQSKTPEDKLDVFLSPKIPNIGIPIASAVLTVCYPNEFTIADYRACASLKDFGEKVHGNPTVNAPAYFEYLDKCKKLAHKYKISLRDFDRILWAKDFYEGENGLKHLIEGLEC